MNIYAKDLLNCIRKIKRTKEHTYPVLNHALFECANGVLTLTTTDLKSVNQESCKCFTDDSFSVCVPMVHTVKVDYEKDSCRYTHKDRHYKMYPFLDLIKVHAEDNDLLTIKYIPLTCEITLQVEHENSISTIKCMDAAEFPNIERIN